MSDATQAEPAEGVSAEFSERFEKFQALYRDWLASRADANSALKQGERDI